VRVDSCVCSAPLAKNLEDYLRKRPNCQVYQGQQGSPPAAKKHQPYNANQNTTQFAAAEYELQQALSKWKESNTKPQILAAKARVLGAKEVLATAKEKSEKAASPTLNTNDQNPTLSPPVATAGPKRVNMWNKELKRIITGFAGKRGPGLLICFAMC